MISVDDHQYELTVDFGQMVFLMLDGQYLDNAEKNKHRTTYTLYINNHFIDNILTLAPLDVESHFLFFVSLDDSNYSISSCVKSEVKLTWTTFINEAFCN